jgi:hypothetical protein
MVPNRQATSLRDAAAPASAVAPAYPADQMAISNRRHPRTIKFQVLTLADAKARRTFIRLAAFLHSAVDSRTTMLFC